MVVKIVMIIIEIVSSGDSCDMMVVVVLIAGMPLPLAASAQRLLVLLGHF